MYLSVQNSPVKFKTGSDIILIHQCPDIPQTSVGDIKPRWSDTVNINQNTESVQHKPFP